MCIVGQIFTFVGVLMAVVSVRIPDDKKKQVSVIVKEMGLSLSTAVNIFINNLIRTRKIEADLNIELDDTHIEWYTDENSFDVNEDAEVVLKYLKDSYAKDMANG